MSPPLNADKIASFIEKGHARYDANNSKHLLYYGGAIASLTQVTCSNGSNPRISPFSLDPTMSLLDGVTVPQQSWMISLPQTADVPSEPENLQWWISTDGGTTKRRVRIREVRQGGSGFIEFLVTE